MLSRCPACATVFRVDTVQIRAREGRVRCGRCHAVFDALDAMVDVPAAPAQAASEHAAAAPPAPEDSHATLNVVDAPDASAHFEAAAVTTDVLDVTEPISQPMPQAGDDMESLVERTTDFWNSSILAEPAAAPDALTGRDASDTSSVEHIDPEAPAAEAGPGQAPDVADMAPEPKTPVPPDDSPSDTEPATETASASAQAPEPSAEPASATDAPPESAGALESLHDPAMQRIRRELYGDRQTKRRNGVAVALWTIGCLLLLVLAAGQLVYHFRTDIALAQPSLKPLLEQTCARIGCSVPTPRQPDQVSIESSELTPEARREPLLRLTALLRNGAPFAQDWPHLELTLTDTSDRAVVRRVLSPAEFLNETADRAVFAAGSEQTISLLIDPADTGASGYRLYAFYP